MFPTPTFTNFSNPSATISLNMLSSFILPVVLPALLASTVVANPRPATLPPPFQNLIPCPVSEPTTKDANTVTLRFDVGPELTIGNAGVCHNTDTWQSFRQHVGQNLFGHNHQIVIYTEPDCAGPIIGVASLTNNPECFVLPFPQQGVSVKMI